MTNISPKTTAKNAHEIEYMGFIIRQIGESSFAVLKTKQQVHICLSEDMAKSWVSKYRKILSRNSSLRHIAEDVIQVCPEDDDDDDVGTNIITLPGKNESEKFIKITSLLNGSPAIEHNGLNDNEILGLLDRAKWQVSNAIMRNGML